MTPNFSDGDWIVNQDGICQVFGLADYYVEDFYKEECESKEIGSFFERKIVYKIFCNFKGVPRKTKFFNHLPARYNKPLAGEYREIFEKCKNENLDLYGKFIERTPSSPVTSSLKFSLRFEPSKRDIAIDQINDLLKNIEKPFCYETFDSQMRKIFGKALPEHLYADRDVLMTNTLVSLDYSVLEPRNKKFSFVGGVAVKTYCSFDEKKL